MKTTTFEHLGCFEPCKFPHCYNACSHNHGHTGEHLCSEHVNFDSIVPISQQPMENALDILDLGDTSEEEEVPDAEKTTT